MGRKELKLETLTELDGGRVPEAFNQALKRCVADCEDRPGVKDARKVTLEVMLSPNLDDDLEFESVDVKFQIKDTAPTRKTKKYNCNWTRGNQLVFDDMSHEDADQGSLPFDNKENEVD